jgi:hypothetical protein
MDAKTKRRSPEGKPEMRPTSTTGEAILTFRGDESFRRAAEQAAAIVAEAFLSPPIRDAQNEGEGLIHIVIDDKGSIDITRQGDRDFNGQKRGTGMLLGTLLGIGLAKRKGVTVDYDNAILDPDRTALLTTYGDSARRRGIGLRFGSFADLAECVNVLARSQDNKIDTAALPKER